METAPVGDLELSYKVVGAGEPLVMVMGIGAQMVAWPEALIDRLVDRGFQLIMFDNRDIGQSTHLTHLGAPDPRWLVAKAMMGRKPSAPYQLSHMAADTVGLMDQLGLDRAHVLGVSMGGMIAQTLAIEHPERVRSLTSIMSTTGSRRHGLGKLSAYKALMRPRPRSREEAQDAAVEIFSVIGSPGFPLDTDGLRRRAGIAFDRAQEPTGFHRQMAAIVSSGSRRIALGKLDLPTLVVHGSEDMLIPVSAGRGTAESIPGARLHVVEGMGHDLPEASLDAWIEALMEVAERG